MKRHRFEPAALVMGLVLLGLAAAFLLDVTGAWDLSDPYRSVRLAASALAVVAVTGIVTQAVRGARAIRKRRNRRP